MIPAALAFQLEQEVSDDGHDQTGHGELDGGGRSGNGEQRLAPGHTADRAAEHGPATDLLEREGPEDLSESVERLVQKAGDGIVGTVAW